MVRELTTVAPNQYEGTIQVRPESWDAEKWREAYGFDVGGEGFASQTNKFIGEKFWNAASPKDGFAIVNCKDSRSKRVLEFLIPILYPEKPTRVIVMVGNTIFGAVLEERKVDWGVVLQAMVAKLVEGARKLKAMPIGPYLFHLYMGQELLNREEMVAYEIGLDLLKYNCTPEPDPDQDQDSPTRPVQHLALPSSTTNGRKVTGLDHCRIRETEMRRRSLSSRRSKRCHTPSTMQSGGWSWPWHSTTNLEMLSSTCASR